MSRLERVKKHADQLALCGNPRMSLLLSSAKELFPTEDPSRNALLATELDSLERMTRNEMEQSRAEMVRVKAKLRAARVEGDLLGPKVKVQR